LHLSRHESVVGLVEGVDQQVAATNDNWDTDEQGDKKHRHVKLLQFVRAT